MSFLLINFVNAQSITPVYDPNLQITITEDSNNIFLNSNNFYIEFNKNFGQPISFYDKQNNDYFDLKFYSLIESNVDNINQKRTNTFASMSFNPSIEDDKIIFTSSDNKIKLIYSVINQQVKAGLEIHNWTTYYANSIFELRTRIHKGENAQANFINLPAVVDGIEQPLIFESEISGQNEFIVQTIYTGSSFSFLEIDPIYNVTINATSPTLLLYGGNNMVDGSNEFDNTTDIAVGISDGSSSTNYFTYYSSSPISLTNLIDGWSFNDYNFGSTLFSFTGEHNGVITGSLDRVEFSDTYYGGYFDGINDYVVVSDHDDFDIPDLGNFSVCTVFNTTGCDDCRLLENKVAGGEGIEFKIDTGITPELKCKYESLTGKGEAKDITTIIDDGELHVMCCIKTGDTVDLWVDGIKTATDTDDIGSISPSIDTTIGGKIDGTRLLNGAIKQFGIFNNSISSSILLWMNETKSISNLSHAQSIQLFFNSTIIESPDKTYFLLINQTSPTTSAIRVMGYINTTHPNSSNYITNTISTGVSYFPIDDILYDGYNYPLRIWNIQGMNDYVFNDIYLYETTNDTTSPNITNCNINTTDISCGESVRFECNVTDNFAIYKTWFSIDNGVLDINEANKNGDVWFLEKTYSNQYNNSIIFNWSVANASDLNGNIGEVYPNLQINYTCLFACVENWVANWSNTSCSFNDLTSWQLEYYDSNLCGTYDDLPIDNGTSGNDSCNYCSEDIETIELTSCEYINGTYNQNMGYQDNNYFSCCGVTSIFSDCSIDYYPFNESFNQVCNTTLETDFSISIDSVLYFGFGIGGLASDKVSGKIWINDTNNTYYCLSYVETINGNLIQTNPPYTKRTTSMISIIPKEIEDREYFQTYNGLTSIYFTNDNLIIDGREYIFGVECAGNGMNLKAESISQVLYENINAPTTRFFWFKDNVTPIFLFLIFLFVIISIIALYIGVLKGR